MAKQELKVVQADKRGQVVIPQSLRKKLGIEEREFEEVMAELQKEVDEEVERLIGS